MCGIGTDNSRVEEHRTVEMLKTPLYEIGLMIKLIVLDFLTKGIDPPSIDSIIEAEIFLPTLGSNNELTKLGYTLARLPVEPRHHLQYRTSNTVIGFKIEWLENCLISSICFLIAAS
ncbi:hypothetical protein LOAG_04222 [Loa loa]|uniref:Uncharacterized protein n=1 Tax=Loa loa TaxID=7209 RepID=A0A1S0U2H4_LOALO|nr:hypothetical protein LOAG_04222 [Loa loa]EFO24262.1 hypothetical protein LOAG_04222 [Loa loa]